MVTEAEIGSRLKTAVMGRRCVCFDRIDSTNLQAKRLAEEGSAPRHAGLRRGADSRPGTPGERLELSARTGHIYEPSSAAPHPAGAGFHADAGDGPCGGGGLQRPASPRAARRRLRLLEGGGPVGLKWPNDLVLDGRKTAGVLTEMSAEIDCIHYVVIGVGINVTKKRSRRAAPGGLSVPGGGKAPSAGGAYCFVHGIF